MMLASFLTVVGSIILIAVSILLIGIILLQKNRGSGLSGAFGGVGGHSAFGTKTGDVLTWVTVGMTAVFLLTAVLLNYGFTPSKPAMDARPSLPVAPAAPAPTGAPAPQSIPVTPVPAPAPAPSPAPVGG